MKNTTTSGIVIKRRNFGEADRIVTIYTQNFGKLVVKAKGVRRITSRRGSHIELLNYTQFSIYKGSHTPILTEAQTINSFSHIKNNLQKTGLAYHICELVDGLCPEEQEQRSIFDLLKRVLNDIAVASDSELIFIVHAFEVELLSQLGYWHKNIEDSSQLDTREFIEGILERKLRSHKVFSKI
ncbi:MAG: DNA repair protein RecO [Candidatus Levybacteria bacterium]|nr:DNA repair protein RecO [Candidatus Levybacteria bacterium]